MNCCAGLPSDFDFAAGVIDAVGDCGLGAVFVDSCGWLGNGCGVDVGVRDIVGPVWAAECVTMSAMTSIGKGIILGRMIEREGSLEKGSAALLHQVVAILSKYSYLAAFDIFVN